MKKFINYTRNGREYTFHAEGEKGDFYFTYEKAYYNAINCSRRYKIGQKAASVNLETGVITTYLKLEKSKGGWEKQKVFRPSKIVSIGSTICYLRKRYIHKDWFAQNCTNVYEIAEKEIVREEVECPF